MTATVSAIVVLVALAVGAVPLWLPRRGPMLRRGGAKIVVLVLAVVGLVASAVLGGLGAGAAAHRPTGWVTFATATAASLLAGGAVTTSVLALADGSPTAPPTGRVRRVVLRGGAWIGALERIAVTATLLAGWPEGVAVIVAIKGLARYPELKTPDTGAGERFIIGTFASVTWAAACAGVALVVVGG